MRINSGRVFEFLYRPAAKIAANNVTGHYHIRRVFLQRMVVVSAPLPGLWRVQIHLNSLAKRSICSVIVAEFRDEHPFEGEKLCFLRHGKVCVVDNFQSGLEFARYLVMTTCLFTQFEEHLRDFYVGKCIDPREAGVAHFEQAMVVCDVRESIDNPGNFVVTAIAGGARAIDALRAIVLLYE